MNQERRLALNRNADPRTHPVGFIARSSPFDSSLLPCGRPFILPILGWLHYRRALSKDDVQQRLGCMEQQVKALVRCLAQLQSRRARHGAGPPLYWGAFVSVGAP